MRKLVLIIAVAMLSFSTSFAGPKEDALDYLHSNQLSSGQWGSVTAGGTSWRSLGVRERAGKSAGYFNKAF